MADSQNDMFMWRMIGAKGVERSVEAIARRMLVAKFAGIHATSLASVDIPSPSESIIHF
jgi:hypothetical protein